VTVLGEVGRRTVWARTDWGIVIAGLGLSGVGTLLVWSATRHSEGSVAGEEWGLVGAGGIIVLIAFLILRTLLIGSRSDPFGQLVCVGVAVWFAVPAFENIGMNLGITPRPLFPGHV
jgi:cell division protein FtsW (lipid II flippase)